MNLERVVGHAGVHLGEEKSEYSLSVLPVEIVKVDLLVVRLWACGCLVQWVKLTKRFASATELGLLLLSLKGDLLADLFLDLLKSFKEELLDLTALRQHHLREGPNVLQFLIFHSQ